MKQNYLRVEVIEKGLDPNEFIGYLQGNRGLFLTDHLEDGDDINSWTLAELKEQVAQFQRKNGVESSEPEPEPQAAPEVQQTEQQPEPQAEIPQQPPKAIGKPLPKSPVNW